MFVSVMSGKEAWQASRGSARRRKSMTLKWRIPGTRITAPPPVVESDDEAEYYRQAVGEEPDEDMFPAAKRRQRPERPSGGPFKKRKPFSGDDRKNKYGSKSPHRSGPRGKPRDRMGGDVDRKEGKRFGDGGKSFGKRFGGRKFGDEANVWRTEECIPS
nr:suppressor of SWI4 1 homolog [Oncorhynchus nerka]